MAFLKTELKKPYHLNILERMRYFISHILGTFPEDWYRNRILLEEFGNLLKDSELPKKRDDVYYIVEELEKMIETCIGGEKSKGTQEYLVRLVEKIRMTFFKTLLEESLLSEEDLKITLNDGMIKIVTRESWVLFTDDPLFSATGFMGKTPEKENLKIFFRDIKFKDGIQALTKGYGSEERQESFGCDVHNSIEHMQSPDGVCPGCGKY
ncbi:hypothetical protein KJ603_01420 [Patescibacteria group bacterium]|nr:hypothetical protein [Patescibacteria group bacterium]